MCLDILMFSLFKVRLSPARLSVYRNILVVFGTGEHLALISSRHWANYMLVIGTTGMLHPPVQIVFHFLSYIQRFVDS